MTPRAEPGPYHDAQPLLHDLQYHLENGVPVLGDQDQASE